jgi:E3 ubiquitin-protein ligase TRIP12
MICSIWPQCLYEFACLCIIDSYYRLTPENLEVLVNAEHIAAVNVLLLPVGGSPLIALITFTQLSAACASPNITIMLLEAGIVDMLYQIWTGSNRPALKVMNKATPRADRASVEDSLMTVMQDLARQPKDQVEKRHKTIADRRQAN